MVLLAACVAAIAVTGVRFAGYGLPGWLDATFDPRFQAQQGRFPVLLDWLPHLGELKAVTVMTFALLLACAFTRRWRGAVLTALAVPVAIGITDYVLKPTVGEAIGAAFPSGHATSSFALAASFAVLLANPPLRVPAGLRLLLALLAVLMQRPSRPPWWPSARTCSATPWAVPRSVSASSWPARSPSMPWAACCGQNQRRHLLLPRDQRRRARPDPRSGRGGVASSTGT